MFKQERVICVSINLVECRIVYSFAEIVLIKLSKEYNNGNVTIADILIFRPNQ